MRYLVTGGAGFLGSHITDRLIAEGHEVIVLDNLSTGSEANVNPKAKFFNVDITEGIQRFFTGVEVVFHCAAIARTPWTIKDPILCNKVNIEGTVKVLEAARQANVKRVVLSSSCIVYAGETPYRVSKQALELWAEIYDKCYGLSTVCLRYSNLYGTRQSELGESPNLFAALRGSIKRDGKMHITGDGTQTRDFTHVSDCVEANILASQVKYTGVLDICTGIQTSLNECLPYFKAPYEYIEARKGDVHSILQSPDKAKEILGFVAKVKLADGIADVL